MLKGTAKQAASAEAVTGAVEKVSGENESIEKLTSPQTDHTPRADQLP